MSVVSSQLQWVDGFIAETRPALTVVRSLRRIGSSFTRLPSIMETVKVSPKFQVVIPRKVREALGIRRGQKIQVLVYQNRIEFIPIKRMKEMRGFLKGIDSTVERDADRV